MVNVFLNLNLLSKYRAELMGIAILLIMCFHCNGSLFAFGFVGVELFLAISAMGLYFSLQKDGNVIRFYKKRLVRILPAYFIVSIPYLLRLYVKGDMQLSTVFLVESQINTLLGHSRFLWFISIILICYIITPFCLAYRRYILSNMGLFVITIICLLLGPSVMPKIIIQRIPIFLIALKLASNVYEAKIVNIGRGGYLFGGFFVLSIFVFFDIEAFWGIPMTYDYILGTLVAFPFLIVFVKLLPYFHQTITRFLRFMGTITLELYLVHELICLPLVNKLFLGNIPSVLIYLVSILLAILMAYTLHFVLSKQNRRQCLHKH